MKNKKYKITVKSEKELMASAKLFTQDGGLVFDDSDSSFSFEMKALCGNKYESELEIYGGKKEYKLLNAPKNWVLSHSMLSCEPEPIEDEVGVWVVSHKNRDFFVNATGELTNDRKSVYGDTVVCHSKNPLFPLEPTFISLSELSEFLKWKETKVVEINLSDEQLETLKNGGAKLSTGFKFPKDLNKIDPQFRVKEYEPLLFLKKDDVEFLKWIYHRLIEVHGENRNVDYMKSFSKLLDKIN